MTQTFRTLFLAVAACSSVAFADAPTTAPTPSAEEMIAAIHGVKMPAFDQSRQSDQAYIQSYMQQQDAALHEQLDRRLAFIRAYPTHNDASGSAMAVIHAAERMPDVPLQPLVDELTALPIKPDAKLMVQALAISALIRGPRAQLEAAVPAVDAFRQQHPNDPNAQMLDFLLAQQQFESGDSTCMRRIATESPDSSAGKLAAGTLRRVDAVGQPFALAFDDVVTGRHIDLQRDYRDKIVVFDFWATWCGPCVAEMPHMKELYAAYHEKGVEFVGVTLDRDAEDGRNKVLTFVRDNQIPWPQFYEGQGWENPFSAGWGVNGIPVIFIVDRAGKLVTMEAGGSNGLRVWLERLTANDSPTTAPAAH